MNLVKKTPIVVLAFVMAFFAITYLALAAEEETQPVDEIVVKETIEEEPQAVVTPGNAGDNDELLMGYIELSSSVSHDAKYSALGRYHLHGIN